MPIISIKDDTERGEQDPSSHRAFVRERSQPVSTARRQTEREKFVVGMPAIRNGIHRRGSWAGGARPRRSADTQPALVQKAFAPVAVAMLLMAPLAARAQATAVAGGSPANIALAIPVSASVASRCSFSVSGTYDVPEITAGFTHDFSMVLKCGTAARVGIVSANGGLLAVIAAPPSGYSRLAPYDVALSLVGNSGVPTATATCAAATLTSTAGAPCTFRGPATATQGLRLGGASSAASGSYLRVSAPVYSGSSILVASTTYADTLTITLSATI